MATIMTARQLHLSLQPGALVPCKLGWRVEEGDLRMVTLKEQAESCSLALWGPGEGSDALMIRKALPLLQPGSTRS